MGTYPRIVRVENMSTPNEMKWKAEAEIVKMDDGKNIGYGFAICSNREYKKVKFDEYAILSMAQTRAIGKAYRNLIGWVMKLAGYEGTPSEEMVKMDGTQIKPVNSATPKSAPAKTAPAKQPKHIECKQCAAVITEAEAKYSQRLFKTNLCRVCQKTHKK